jgi:endonuclease/exonuclease/phosphatase family metal-dependent hydrolase
VAFTIFVATETWLVPIEGWFVDRFGPRIVVTFGGVVVAIAWALNSTATSLAMLYVAAAIAGVGADVVALQEVALMTVDGVVADMPAELARLTGYDVRYAAVGHFGVVDPDTGDAIGASMWGNAILSRLPIVSSAGLGLPIAADDDLVELPGAIDTWTGEPSSLAGVRYADAPTGSREPRALVRATIETPAGRVHVLGTHLTHVGSGQRRSQAAFIADLAAGLNGPAVVAGDLNARIGVPALAPLAASMTDAFEATGTGPDDPARASCGPAPIDHVLVRDLVPVACAVDRRAGDLSDHWPVRAVLEMG